MGLSHADKQCALCHASLSAWSACACTLCGKKLCGRHAHATRRLHSHVLSSMCDECVHQAAVAKTKIVVKESVLV